MRNRIAVVAAVALVLVLAPVAAVADPPSLEQRVTALESSVSSILSRITTLEGQRTYTVTDSVSVSPQGSLASQVIRTASCSNGDLATGGGYRVNGADAGYDPAFRILHSYPFVTSMPVGWSVGVNNGTVNNVTLETYAVCWDK